MKRQKIGLKKEAGPVGRPHEPQRIGTECVGSSRVRAARRARLEGGPAKPVRVLAARPRACCFPRSRRERAAAAHENRPPPGRWAQGKRARRTPIAPRHERRHPAQKGMPWRSRGSDSISDGAPRGSARRESVRPGDAGRPQASLPPVSARPVGFLPAGRGTGGRTDCALRIVLAPRVRERRPMKRRDISIATVAAVLALQARFDIEMAGGHQPDPRPDRRANQQA